MGTGRAGSTCRAVLSGQIPGVLALVAGSRLCSNSGQGTTFCTGN